MAYYLHCDEHDFHGVRVLLPDQNADPKIRYLAIFDVMWKMWGDDRCGCRDLSLLARFDPKAVAE